MNPALQTPARGYQKSLFVGCEAGDFASIQAAINAIPDGIGGEEFAIFIRRGVYQEHLHVPPSKGSVALIGEDRESTLVTVGPGSAPPLQGSVALMVECARFRAENLSFENCTPLWHLETSAPAAAAKFMGGVSEILFCSFLGWQDTLWSVSGCQRLRECYIEGHSDWVRGEGKVEFEKCEVHCRSDAGGGGSSVQEVQRRGGKGGVDSFFSILWSMAGADRLGEEQPEDNFEGEEDTDFTNTPPSSGELAPEIPSGSERTSSGLVSTSSAEISLDVHRVQQPSIRWDASGEEEGGSMQHSDVSRIRGGGVFFMRSHNQMMSASPRALRQVYGV